MASRLKWPAARDRVRSGLLRRLRGRQPVAEELVYPLFPHPLFSSRKPLLLVESEPRPSVFERMRKILLFRWRGGRLERLAPLFRVRAVEGGEKARRETLDVDAYQLDFPVEELAVVYVVVSEGARRRREKTATAYLIKGCRALGTFGRDWVEREVKRVVRRETGVEVETVEIIEDVGGLNLGDPLSSLRWVTPYHFQERQLSPVVVPGWLTVVGPVAFLFASKDGVEWREREAVHALLTDVRAAYAREDEYFVALGHVKEEALQMTPLPEVVKPPSTSSHYPLVPIAWRLPEARLPNPVRQALLKSGRASRRELEVVDAIIREVGPKWP